MVKEEEITFDTTNGFPNSYTVTINDEEYLFSIRYMEDEFYFMIELPNGSQRRTKMAEGGWYKVRDDVGNPKFLMYSINLDRRDLRIGVRYAE